MGYKDDDEETLWLWERTGESASLLTNEGNLLQEVRCPMFPRVQAKFTLDGRSYLATESCSGETLAEQLCAGKLEPHRAVSILSQVAFALTKLHDAGFVHLGLRPGVIVPGRPTKILDFSDVTQVGVTPARKFYHAGYSAPELLREEPADVRSDIYAVGALLFHAVDGKPIAESGVELMAWEPEAPIAGVPQILSRCLGEKDTRYSSAAELHRDLVRLVKRLTPPVRYAWESPRRSALSQAERRIRTRLLTAQGPWPARKRRRIGSWHALPMAWAAWKPGTRQVVPWLEALKPRLRRDSPPGYFTHQRPT